MNNKQIGEIGERLAAQWLAENDFSIIEKNWRDGRYEIDIVAIKENVVHCIEVKFARGVHFGYPEKTIRKKKIDNMNHAAELYVRDKNEEIELQIDVLSITRIKGVTEFYMIEQIGC